MSQPPAFQFYPRDYVMSTRVLTHEQRGVFMDLLCFAWDGDGLPDEPAEMAAMVGLTPAKFRKVWAAVRVKWELCEDGRWRNPRQERTRQEQAEHRAGREKAALKAAHKRWGHDGDVDDCELCQSSQAA